MSARYEPSATFGGSANRARLACANAVNSICVTLNVKLENNYGMGMKMICIQVTQPHFEKLSIYLLLKVCHADLIMTAIFFELIVEHEQKIVVLKTEDFLS